MMNCFRFPTFLASVVAASLLYEGIALAATPRHTQLVFDREPEIDPVVAGVSVAVQSALEERGVKISMFTTDPLLTIYLRPLDNDGPKGYTYSISLTVAETVLNASEAQLCVGCDADALANSIAASIPAIADAIPARPERTPTPRDVVPSSRSISESAPPPSGYFAQSRPGLLYTGLGVSVLGGAAIGVGSVLWARGEVSVDTGVTRTHTDYRPVGIGVAVSGAVALAVGVTLAVLGFRGKRKRSP